MSNPAESRLEFEKAGAEKESGLLRELWAMMRQNKKYWLGPVIIILVLFGLLIGLSSTAAAPFIYSLF